MRSRRTLTILLACLPLGGLGLASPAADGDPRASLGDRPLVIYFYVGGQAGEAGTIPADSAGMKALAKLLKAERRWRPTLVSYAPKTYLRSAEFTVNLMDEQVVINYPRHQLVAPVAAAEGREAREALRASRLPALP